MKSVSPDPNLPMQQSEEVGRWDGESLENWALPRKAGPFLIGWIQIVPNPLDPYV